MKTDQNENSDNIVYDALIEGKDENELTELETKIALIWAYVLKKKAINIHDTFHDMGGDSLLAATLLRALESYFPGDVNISDIYTYPTVYAMAKHLDEKLMNKNKNADGKNAVDNIDNILDQLSKGNISSEDATKLLNTDM
jgi:hypothetical protein